MSSRSRLLITFLLTCILFLTHATPATYDYDNCGTTTKTKYVNNNKSFLIMGGSEIDIDEAPWTVGVSRIFQGFNHMCTGTLISSRHVLTAAHCLSIGERKPSLEHLKKEMIITIGASCVGMWKTSDCDVNKAGKQYKIVNASLFEPYFEEKDTMARVKHDIAVLELENDVISGSPHICLPTIHGIQNFSDTTMYSVAGFGKNPQGESNNTYNLRLVALGRESPSCDKTLGTGVMCITENDQKAVCNGDSGAAIYTYVDGKAYIRGVLSISHGCDEILRNPRNNHYSETNVDILHQSQRILQVISS